MGDTIIKFIIYLLSVTSISLAISGLSAYSKTRHIGLLLSSIVSITCSVIAIINIAWWPLVIGFALNWGLRLLGLDPGYRR